MHRSTRARRLLAAVLATTALVGAACGDDGDTTDDDAVEDTTTTEEEEAAATTEAEPTETTEAETTEPEGSATAPVVTVVDPGAEPRQELRYQLTAGSSTVSSTTIEQSVEIAADGEPPEAFTASFRFDLTATVESVDEAGAVLVLSTSGVEVLDVEGPPGLDVATLEAELVALEGLGYRFSLDERGFPSDVTVEGGDGFGTGAAGTSFEQILGQVESLVVPLPEEPVGVGAVLEVVNELEAAGATTTSTSTLSLTEIGDGTLSFDVEQSIELGGGDATLGASIEGSGTSSGTSTYDLRAGTTRSDLTSSTESTIEVEQGPGPGPGPSVLRQTLEQRIVVG